jgi:hypothetical protein
MLLSINRIRTTGVVLAIVLFILSLGFSTLLYAEDSSFLVGLACLLFGLSYPAWWANPFLFFAGCLLKERKPAWALANAAIATVLILSTFTITHIERNEAGTLAPVIGYGLGFFLWLGCGLVLLSTSLVCVVLGKSQPRAAATLQHSSAPVRI